MVFQNVKAPGFKGAEYFISECNSLVSGCKSFISERDSALVEGCKSFISECDSSVV